MWLQHTRTLELCDSTLFEVSKDEQNYNLVCEHCSLVKSCWVKKNFVIASSF